MPPRPRKTAPVRLDLACGQNKQEGFTGIDVAGNYDIKHDLLVTPWPVKTGTIEETFCSHFVEHIPHYRPEFAGVDGWWVFFNELYRVSKAESKHTFVHPYAKSDRAFWDPTHTRYVHETTWYYLSKEWRTAQGLDHYDATCDFEVIVISGNGIADSIATKHHEAQAFARQHYWNAIADLIVQNKGFEIAAPSTPVLDDFNRADGALGANWTQAVATYSMPLIVSNQMNWPQFPSAAWATAFAADQEIYLQGQNPTTAGVQMMVRMNNLNTASLNGYGVNASSDPGSAVEAFSWTAGVATSLGFFAGIIQAGDDYRWLNITANVLSLYAGSDGVTWTLRKQWLTNGLYRAGGNIGVYNPNNGSASFIEFVGGGSVTASASLAWVDA